MLLLPGVKRRQPTDRANTELKSKKDLTLHPSFSLHMLARVSSRSHAKVKLMILKLELSLSLSLCLSFFLSRDHCGKWDPVESEGGWVSKEERTLETEERIRLPMPRRRR